jgi:hypothetical protein
MDELPFVKFSTTLAVSSEIHITAFAKNGLIELQTLNMRNTCRNLFQSLEVEPLNRGVRFTFKTQLLLEQ